MTYRIDSSVPVPECKGVYPFGRMKVGDSIWVVMRWGKSAVRSSHGFAKRHPGWGFTARREGDGVRIWCVECPQTVGKLPVRLVNKLGAW